MTAEQRCFLELLRDCVHRRPSAPPAEAVDWAAVARYAEEQSLGGILYVQCRTFLPPDSPARHRQTAPLSERAARTVLRAVFR